MRAWTKVVAAGLLCGLTLAPIGVARASDTSGARIDINTASATELARLPGIVEFRAKEPFTRADDLRKVKGIGDKLFESIKDQVTVGDGPSSKGGRGS